MILYGIQSILYENCLLFEIYNVLFQLQSFLQETEAEVVEEAEDETVLVEEVEVGSAEVEAEVGSAEVEVEVGSMVDGVVEEEEVSKIFYVQKLKVLRCWKQKKYYEIGFYWRINYSYFVFFQIYERTM